MSKLETESKEPRKGLFIDIEFNDHTEQHWNQAVEVALRGMGFTIVFEHYQVIIDLSKVKNFTIT